jgi:hypothetical protein
MSDRPSTGPAPNPSSPEGGRPPNEPEEASMGNENHTLRSPDAEACVSNRDMVARILTWLDDEQHCHVVREGFHNG